MIYSAAQAGKFRDRGADGLVCPECGATAHNVADSRARGGTIYRRRVCRNLHRFSTVEAAGRVARLNGLVAQLDALPPEDLALAVRLGPDTRTACNLKSATHGRGKLRHGQTQDDGLEGSARRRAVRGT